MPYLPRAIRCTLPRARSLTCCYQLFRRSKSKIRPIRSSLIPANAGIQRKYINFANNFSRVAAFGGTSGLRSIASPEMRRHVLAHQLQRAYDFVRGKPAAAIELGEHAAETERAGHLREPLHHGIGRSHDHLV